MGVRLTISLPVIPQYLFYSWSSPCFVSAGNYVVCLYPEIAAGASVTAIVKGHILEAPTLLDAGTSTVTAENPDPVPANNSVAVTTTVVPAVRMGGCFGASEGDSGTTDSPCPAYLTGPHDRPILVSYTLEGVTATAGMDFVAASGTLTFPVGVDAAQVPITYIGDTLPEGNERSS